MCFTGGVDEDDSSPTHRDSSPQPRLEQPRVRESSRGRDDDVSSPLPEDSAPAARRAPSLAPHDSSQRRDADSAWHTGSPTTVGGARPEEGPGTGPGAMTHRAARDEPSLRRSARSAAARVPGDPPWSSRTSDRSERTVAGAGKLPRVLAACLSHLHCACELGRGSSASSAAKLSGRGGMCG